MRDTRRTSFLTSTLVPMLGVMVLSVPAIAATLCVNPGGSSGCSATIGAAVSAANAGDTINIGPGSYTEGVVVTKPLSLVGAGADATIINAKGQPNGIYVDGLDNPGLLGGLITGLTIMNANFEGILVTNASYLTISANHVTGNNQSLNVTGAACPGLPLFETSESEDCGEGIHLMGVDHATVAGNTVDLNSGGILLSDETGQTYNNMITGNSVHDNPYDCGITLASHPPSPQAASKLPYGVFNNTVANNNSSNNGGSLPGGGAGVGIFAPGPGNQNFANRVIGNILRNNGHPGVSIHNHAAPAGAPGVNLNDTMIIGNTISGNGADTADAATPGTTGINIYSVADVWGTMIAGNTITDEADGVDMHAVGAIEMHMNDLDVQTAGVVNLGTGVINATVNFWGCPGGPGAMGCSSVVGPFVTTTASLPGPAGSGLTPGKGHN